MFDSQMLVCQLCHHPSLRRAVDQPVLYQIRFIYVLDGSGILTGIAAASVSSPTGPPANFPIIVIKMFLSF